MIDLNSIAKLLTQRTAEVFPICLDWTSSDWFLELVGEVGEAGNIIKKLNRGDENHAELKQKLAEEFSDILLCLLLNARFHNIDLEEAIPVKFNSDSRKRNSDIRLEPKLEWPGCIYGLSYAQIWALIAYYQDLEGVDFSELQNLTPEEISQQGNILCQIEMKE